MKVITDARRGDIPRVLGAAAGVGLDGGEVVTSKFTVVLTIVVLIRSQAVIKL